MTGSVTMSNGSRAIARASTSGMPWTIWSPKDHRHRTAYAPSEFGHFYDDLLKNGLRNKTIIRMQSDSILLF